MLGLNDPRSRSPTSPTFDPTDAKGPQLLFFCRFPNCSKGYASTDGVRKHCRKHHPEWLADLDEATKESNMKHSAASYCTTRPSDPEQADIAADKLSARKRPRADSASPPLEAQASEREVGRESKSLAFPTIPSWPPLEEPTGELLRPASHDSTTQPRCLFSSLEREGATWEDGRPGSPIEPVSQSFFKLDSGMPVPKRGLSLTSDAMLELARESEDTLGGGSLSLEVFFKDDPLLEPEPLDELDRGRRESVDFLGDVWA